jgi:hypothetical protein
MALLAVIKRMNEQRTKASLPRCVDPKQSDRDGVPHGFRSSFRDWAAERTTTRTTLLRWRSLVV